MRLKDISVVLTGGANGLGSHYCAHLVGLGARVLVADVDEQAAKTLAERLNDELGGTRCVALRVDTTNEADTVEMIDTARREFGGVDVLINNVGTYPHTPFESIDYELWRRVVTVNLDSVFLCCRAVVPVMRAAGHGKIINIATNLVWLGLPAMAHYIAAKAGVVGLTRALARELGDAAITVNALAPGAVIDNVQELGPDGLARLEQIVSHQCLKWCERPEDIEGALAFLVSDASDFVSGQVLTVDGGLSMH